jgi:hypothetical protein
VGIGQRDQCCPLDTVVEIPAMDEPGTSGSDQTDADHLLSF